jgi:ElaB/YqjD/DUF883 family membrane-anchored ribosome-binding protein
MARRGGTVAYSKSRTKFAAKADFIGGLVSRLRLRSTIARFEPRATDEPNKTSSKQYRSQNNSRTDQLVLVHFFAIGSLAANVGLTLGLLVRRARTFLMLALRVGRPLSF